MTVPKTRLLVVDDEPDVLSSIQSFFARRGFVVSTTCSGSESLILINHLKPDLVFLDFKLVDLNGPEVIRSLRQSGNNTKIIVITGEILKDALAQELKDLGVIAYFQKPLDLDELNQTVKNVLLGAYPQQIRIPFKKAVLAPTQSKTRALHQLANELCVIKTKCEEFLLNEQDGLFQDEKPEVTLQKAKQVIAASFAAVDKASFQLDNLADDEQ